MEDREIEDGAASDGEEWQVGEFQGGIYEALFKCPCGGIITIFDLWRIDDDADDYEAEDTGDCESCGASFDLRISLETIRAISECKIRRAK